LSKGLQNKKNDQIYAKNNIEKRIHTKVLKDRA